MKKILNFIYENLKDFDKDCVLDGKLIDSYSKKENNKATSDENKKIIEEKIMHHGLTKYTCLQMDRHMWQEETMKGYTFNDHL